jgi:hypothetical protein
MAKMANPLIIVGNQALKLVSFNCVYSIDEKAFETRIFRAGNRPSEELFSGGKLLFSGEGTIIRQR